MIKMKRKVRVWFDIQPKLEFTTKEIYSNLNIIPEYTDSKLIGLQVDIEVNLNDDDEIIKEIARHRIISLIERLRYLTKVNLKTEIKRTKQTDPLETKSTGYKTFSVNACIVKPCPMPGEDDVLKQDQNTVNQLMYYNRGIKADDVAEKIKNFHMVIEKEEKISKSYSMLNDLRYTRTALSHPRLTKSKSSINFLKKQINSDSLDFNNPNHIEFLRTMLPKFKQEAEKILDKKVY